MTENLCPLCGSELREGHKCYVIPTSCWKPREGTGIPADAQMYPPGCPDPDWCRGRFCFWQCKIRDEEFGVMGWVHAMLTIAVGLLAYVWLTKSGMMPW